MKFKKNLGAFLDGERFSNGLSVSFLGDNHSKDRISLIAEIVESKKVIHVGCADHIPLIEKKINGSKWLHGRLVSKASKVVGFDIDSAAVKHITDLGVENVYCHDVVKDEVHSSVSGQKWDYLILGEVVEHVGNPVSFLQSISKKYSDNAEFIVITAPNAFKMSNFFKSIFGTEFINTDHRFWFTPYTLAKIVHDSSMVVEDIFIVDSFPVRNPFKKLIGYFSPLIKENLVLVARFSK